MTARRLLFLLGLLFGCCAVAAVVRVVIALGSGSEHRRDVGAAHWKVGDE